MDEAPSVRKGTTYYCSFNINSKFTSLWKFPFEEPKIYALSKIAKKRLKKKTHFWFKVGAVQAAFFLNHSLSSVFPVLSKAMLHLQVVGNLTLTLLTHFVPLRKHC